MCTFKLPSMKLNSRTQRDADKSVILQAITLHPESYLVSFNIQATVRNIFISTNNVREKD